MIDEKGECIYMAALLALGFGIAIYARYDHRKSKARYLEVKKEIETNARSRDQPLTPEKLALYDAIKEKAAELEALYENLSDGRYKALAMTDLEASVMWIIKGLTA
jgi:hypothetical protein